MNASPPIASNEKTLVSSRVVTLDVQQSLASEMPLGSSVSNKKKRGAEKRGAERITIKDVAARVGVNLASVSVVLNGAKSNSAVAESTRLRILAAAEEMGYRRNGSMVAARSGRFKAVGLLMSTLSNRSYLPPELLQGINDASNASDLHLILQQLPDEKLTDAAFVPKILREWMCDGLLIDYTHGIPQAMLELIHQSNTPAIWLNTKLDADCVYSNDFEAGKSAGQHLLNLGHKRIVYSSHLELVPQPPATHYSATDRRDGCKAALKAANLPLEIFAVGEDWPYEQRVAGWVEKLKAPNRPTALVVYGGLDCSIIYHATEILGLRIPQDLSIIIFGGRPYEQRGQYVTMMTLPEHEVGRAAVGMLMQKIEQPEQAFPPLALPFSFEPGETCAPVSSLT